MNKTNMMNKLIMCAVTVSVAIVSLAMPTDKEQRKARPKVMKIMSGLKGFGEAEQAGIAMKASEFVKTEAEKFLLLQGAYRKYLKVKDYAKAAEALDRICVAVGDVPESYLNEQLDKALKGVPVGEAAELRDIREAHAEKRPRVLAVTPAPGDMQVDPSVKEIVIRFDRPMMDRSWSICGNGMCDLERMNTTDKPSFDEEMKVLTVPVALEPGRVYHMSFNGGRSMSFMSKEGVCLRPYRYAFGVK